MSHREIRALVIGLCWVVVILLGAGGIGYGAFWLFGSKNQLVFAIVASTFLSLVTPFMIIAIRSQVRIARIKLIGLFASTFAFNTTIPNQNSSIPSVNSDSNTNQPSPEPLAFEFVKGKYFVDLDAPKGSNIQSVDVPRYPFATLSDWMLLICALPFIAVSTFGCFLLFAPVIDFIETWSGSEGIKGSVGRWIWPSILTLGGAPSNILQANYNDFLFQYYHVNSLTIGAMAFAGAYFYSLRLLLRSVAVFDLNAVTFLRCFAHIILSVLIAVVLYRVTPSINAIDFFWEDLKAAVTNESPCPPPGQCEIRSADPRHGVSSIWLVVAFVLGFIPEAAIHHILRKSKIAFKDRNSAIERLTKTNPVTVLDGIDHYVAFRLEEANIYDVQNLATSNPIMIHIETPFGIYEVIDWVAQAQLCTVVGAERFIMLRMMNIRTIFDFERAMLSEKTDETMVRAVGAVLFMDSSRDRDGRASLGVREIPWPPRTPHDVVDALETRQELSFQALQHAASLIVDDLHVHRLRQIWKLISMRLGSENAAFDDTRRQ